MVGPGARDKCPYVFGLALFEGMPCGCGTDGCTVHADLWGKAKGVRFVIGPDLCLAVQCRGLCHSLDRSHHLTRPRVTARGAGGGGPITIPNLMNPEHRSNLQVRWVQLSVGHWRTAANPLLRISVAHPQASSCLLFCDRKVPMVL